MPPEFTDSRDNPIAAIYGLYTSLVQSCALDSRYSLGGKLIFAGGLEGDAKDLLFAANIAGAASLAAAADPAVQRQAIRDGAVDFLVTSLEEALRILKNEIRKQQAVSVGVGVDPGQLAEAMLDRGVLPDLLPPLPWSELSEEHRRRFQADGSRPLTLLRESQHRFVRWNVDREFVRWLPRLDACLQAVIPVEDLARRRWLRLAPKYLGRMAQRVHGIALTDTEISQFREQAAALLQQHLEDATADNHPIQIRIDGMLVG
ncbi:hypothetical protein [Acidicapsa ligni]|uniref:hypothetical protein n=1 Tax=Acidicapsa ligni TaxID=542300 RepID=UPI0021E06B44|nr:hypothetical protein [Acidicapsa ligni]